MSPEDYHVTKSFEKQIKIVKFTSESCWLLISEKDFLSQDSRFSFFGCIMSNSITYLVMSFNFFASGDIFGIMVEKIQEGWEKSLILVLSWWQLAD